MLFRTPFFLFIVLLSCGLSSCQDTNTTSDLRIQKLDSTESQEKIHDSWDKGFDAGWYKGVDEGWDKGFDDGWNLRGNQLPDMYQKEDVDFKGLKGTRQIKVLIHREHDELNFDDLCKNKIESALRALGIEVVDKCATTNTGLLQLRYRVVKFGDDYAMRASMIFFKIVIFVEERTIEQDKNSYIFTQGVATCWKEPYETLNLSVQNPKTALFEFLQENMDAFVNDWLKENPKF